MTATKRENLAPPDAGPLIETRSIVADDAGVETALMLDVGENRVTLRWGVSVS